MLNKRRGTSAVEIMRPGALIRGITVITCQCKGKNGILIEEKKCTSISLVLRGSYHYLVIKILFVIFRDNDTFVTVGCHSNRESWPISDSYIN